MLKKRLVKLLIPPIIMDILKNLFPQNQVNLDIAWSGNYTSWAEAKTRSIGYDSDLILEKCKSSLLKVKNGEAVYERDSVLFDEIEYSFPLLSGLMWIAAQKESKLNIIDFGGSFGSTYFQNRFFLQDLKEINWNIVEQPGFVEIGKKEFENKELSFFYTIDECLEMRKPNTILLSGVIQYLESPYEFIKKVLEYDFEFIIIDRTSFVLEGNDVLTIQKVPAEIYDASYPSWLFNKKTFLKSFLNNYCLQIEFNSHEGFIINTGTVSANYKGFILKKKEKWKS